MTILLFLLLQFVSILILCLFVFVVVFNAVLLYRSCSGYVVDIFGQAVVYHAGDTFSK